MTFKGRFYVDKCKRLNLPIQLLCFQEICSQGCKKVTALNGDAIIQRDIRSNITITGYTARYGRGGWWGVLIFVTLKEGYQLASCPVYIEVRYVSKWYLSVKLHTLPRRMVVRLFSIRRSNKVLCCRITEFDVDEVVFSV